MTHYTGKGWHFQHTRHSNARKYGKAGGVYAKRYVLIGKSQGQTRILGSFKKRIDAETKEGLLGFEPTDEKVKYEIKEYNPKRKAGWYDIGHKHYGKTRPKAPLKEESTELPIQFSINVPSTKNIDEPISPEEFQARIDETKKFLSTNFGGDTEIKGKGDYTKDGRLIQDDVSVIESSMKPEAYKENKKKLEEYIAKKQKEWTQDNIGYSFEDAFYIYPKFD